MTSSTNNVVVSVKNALRLLRLFRNDRTEIGISEMATLLNLPKSTVHRLVNELVAEGFLVQSRHTTKYHLGFSVLTLGGLVQMQHEMYQEARPILQKLSDSFQQVVNLCLIEQDKVVYFIQCHPFAETEITTAMGFAKDMHCNAEGQVLLCYQDAKVIEQFVSKPLRQYTPHTHTGQALQQQLQTIYKQGFAITEHTYALGYMSFAYPVRDYTGRVVASIALIAHESTVSTQQYPTILTALKKAAETISELLGYYY